MDWISAYSAASGFAVGFAAACFVAWWQQRQRAYARLRSLMLTIGRELYHNHSSPNSLIMERIDDIRDAVWDCYRYTWIPNRSKILALGDELVGRKAGTMRFTLNVPDQAAAERLVDEILTFVGCPCVTSRPNHSQE